VRGEGGEEKIREEREGRERKKVKQHGDYSMQLSPSMNWLMHGQSMKYYAVIVCLHNSKNS
jgi:hypothetical protein